MPVAAATPRILSQAGSNPGTPKARRQSKAAETAPGTPNTNRRLSKVHSDPPSPPRKVGSPKPASAGAQVPSLLAGGNKLGMLRCDPDEAGLDAKSLEEHRRRNRVQASLGVLPGLAECIISGDRIAYLDLMGSADIERGTPVKLSTLFRCFSMTKPITAVGLMKLVEAKQVALDDPVYKYIPSFQNMSVVKREHTKVMKLKPEDIEPVKTTMTLRHLLTHTSGLAYGPDRCGPDLPLKAGSPEEKSYLPLVQAVDDGSIRNLAGFCDALAKLPLRFQPGTQWMYSHGVDVVGRIIEVVSGRPLDAFLREEVFQPLGMTRTHFFVDQNRARDLAAMYLAKEPRSWPQKPKGEVPSPGREDNDAVEEPQPAALRPILDEKVLEQLRPASLKRVDGHLPEGNQESRWASGNRRRRGGVLAGGGIMGSCGGGLVSCLQDIALFVSMLANQGRANSGTQLLQSSTVRTLWRDWLAFASVVGHRYGRTRKLPGWPYGPSTGWNPLGHVRRKDKCLFMGGWSTSWAIYPKTRLATISMSQSLVYFDVPGWVARKDELDSATEFAVANHRRRLAQQLRHRQIRKPAPQAKHSNWKLKATHLLRRALRKGQLRVAANNQGNVLTAGAKAGAARRKSGVHATPAEPQAGPQAKRRRCT